MFIKAQNGNVVETEDDDIARRALKDGHEVYVGDPREKGAKKWHPAAADAEPEADEK